MQIRKIIIKKRKHFTPKDKQRTIKNLILKYGLRCWYCGIRLSRKIVEIDHIIPLAKNGLDEFENLALSCKECNHHKWDLSPEEFLKHLAHIRSGYFECLILEEIKIEKSNINDRLRKNFF